MPIGWCAPLLFLQQMELSFVDTMRSTFQKIQQPAARIDKNIFVFVAGVTTIVTARVDVYQLLIFNQMNESIALRQMISHDFGVTQRITVETVLRPRQTATINLKIVRHFKIAIEIIF